MDHEFDFITFAHPTRLFGLLYDNSYVRVGIRITFIVSGRRSGRASIQICSDKACSKISAPLRSTLSLFAPCPMSPTQRPQNLHFSWIHQDYILISRQRSRLHIPYPLSSAARFTNMGPICSCQADYQAKTGIHMNNCLPKHISAEDLHLMSSPHLF